MNGGASVFFIFLIGVVVVFGAGYLYAQSNQMIIANATCEEAIRQAVVINATAEPQVTQAALLRDDLQKVRALAEEYKAAQQKAENERNVLASDLANTRSQLASEQQTRANAEAAARAEAEKRAAVDSQLAAERDARVKAEGENAALKANIEKVTGERNQAINVLDTANKENEALRAKVDELQMRIAVTGGESKTVESGKTVPETSLPWGSFALVGAGAVIFLGAFFAGRSTSRGSKQNDSMQYAKDVTTVVMSVEEARRYAREARKAGRGGPRPN